MSQVKKVLLADDDPDILEQVAMTLQSEGYEIETANGQEEAEEKLLSFVPDIAVIDLMMEHMDSGFVLCYNIKKLFPGTPVIILTAVTASTGLDFTANSDDAKSWVRADLIMDKPVRPEQLKKEVRRLLHI